MISEKGSLKDTSPIRVLISIFEQGHTGILYLKQNDVLKVLYFNKGRLIWAISNSEEDKLENIIISENLLEYSTLENVKKELAISDSIGKILVEKGLISLENLIDCTKKQLKHIILSVLAWDSGAFQFTKDAPPEKILSLDLNVVEFVLNYILKRMDINKTWEEIKSMQVVLQKTLNSERIAKFQLSKKYSDFLNVFQTPQTLEQVLARYSAEHKDSLLRIIYFYLISGLIEKQEDVFRIPETIQAASPKNDFLAEEAKSDPLIEPPKHYQKDSFDQDDDSYRVDLDPQLQAEEIDNKQPVPPPAFLKEALEEDETEKNKPGKFNRILVAAMVLVIVGLSYIIWKVVSTEDKFDSSVMEEQKVVEKEIKTEALNLDLKTVEKNSDKQSGESADLIPEVTEIPIITDKKNTEDIKKVEKKEIIQEKPEKLKKDEQLIPAAADLGKDVKSYFKEGNYSTAADIWKRQLDKKKYPFGILLELDCQKESVLNAYNKFDDKSGFYILPRQLNDKICFYVMWGKYATEADAVNDFKNIPAYFLNQQNPPRVMLFDTMKY